MTVLKGILMVVFAIDCIALILLVLMQEGKQQGLGSLGGMSDSTFWSQNKGRSMEGTLARVTKYLAILFILLAIVLNLPVFA
ncbi:preprotein translocase subunit SecG [Ohessyouella blattaphilus]|uniref:Protein-export membrane protein SecG n=1 Tax=Ohessyouella blattaphilus TaxID=2949333 RepID=A0ABT1EJ03_9FIRM|nr:preprotein translocase subunit SecG [Ohessyouella blattaphilus]MCP1110677.1 preprotein translocase subunit SecG [Ohessyouella blattaphilus]MCR8564071.1 preprotein translocase subunit SecG [Ohessyouella blattaphilus]